LLFQLQLESMRCFMKKLLINTLALCAVAVIGLHVCDGYASQTVQALKTEVDALGQQIESQKERLNNARIKRMQVGNDVDKASCQAKKYYKSNGNDEATETRLEKAAEEADNQYRSALTQENQELEALEALTSQLSLLTIRLRNSLSQLPPTDPTQSFCLPKSTPELPEEIEPTVENISLGLKQSQQLSTQPAQQLFSTPTQPSNTFAPPPPQPSSQEASSSNSSLGRNIALTTAGIITFTVLIGGLIYLYKRHQRLEKECRERSDNEQMTE